MAKIIVGLSRKRPGPEQFSSDGHHLTVEMDVEVTNPQEFHSQVKALFAEVNAALDDETDVVRSAPKRRADLWTGNGNGGRTSRAHTGTSNADNGNGDSSNSEPISNKQAAYLTQLLAKQGVSTQADVSQWLRETLDVSVSTQYELDKRTASRAIEMLKDKAPNGR
jgi:hypothetical protein